MGLIEVADFARIAVMVRVQGPFRQDNTLSVRNAFYGFRLSRKIFWDSICLTVASVIKPFLSQPYREKAIQVGSFHLFSCCHAPRRLHDKAHLIHGAQIYISVEGKSDAEDNDNRADKESLPWLPAELLGIVDIPQSSTAVQSLIEAFCGLMENGWEVGWSLASHSRGPQHIIGNSRAQVENSSF